MIKKYPYTSHDGNHFPDAERGDNLYYAIDVSEWLQVEEDTLTKVEWIIPKQVSSEENFLVGSEAHIKVATDKIGTFKLVCKITSEENGKSQTNSIAMMLRVY